MGARYIRGKSMAIKQKRGIFFTTTAIALVLIIILSFVIQSEYRLRNKMYVIETRVETVNDFIIDIERDLSRGLFITGFRALLAIQKHIATNGVFLNDVNSQFKKVLLDGVIEEEQIDIMDDSTFTDWTQKIKQEAEKIDIEINFSIMNISIYHQDPWFMTIESSLIIIIKDKKGTANWTRNKTIATKLSIEGFEDPLYTINSFGKVINIIKKANETDFSVVPNFVNHINNSYYIKSNAGPDFLMRLEGKTSSSLYGVESLVNLNKFFQQNLQTYDKSNVDYIYFGNVTVSSCTINGTISYFSWFRLDNNNEPYNHLNDYDANCFS